MIKKYKSDANEILDILSELYVDDVKNNIQYKDEVIKCLCTEIENDYLNKRMQEFKKIRFDLKQEEMICNLYIKYCNHKKCNECPISKYCNYNIKCKISNVDSNAPTMIDLFCGAGGLSLGFVQNGFSIALANDIEECCVDTYSHNHPEVPRKHIVCGDINNVISQINELKRFDKIDVVVGGPPCQRI